MGDIRFHDSKGVTLVELLVVLVLVSIALSIVVPSFGKTYETWVLRSVSRKTVVLFRFASDTARRHGSDIAGYYDEHRLVLLENGSVLKADGYSRICARFASEAARRHISFDRTDCFFAAIRT